MGSSCYPSTLLYQSPAEDVLARRVAKMDRELEALRMRSEHPYELDFNAAPAFTSKIMEKPIPPRFKMPQIELYNGSVDPLDHLKAFKVLMLLHGANDGTLCLAFSATLRKATRQWFFNLLSRSVNFFEWLRRLFISYFINSRCQRCMSDMLIDMK